VEVHRLSGLDLRHSGRVWEFAAENRARIDEHWRGLKAQRPHVWNGEVLVCLQTGLDGGVLRAELTTTDYASFLAWRDWGAPDKAARNCFGSPVVLTSDRAIIFGEMAAATLNGGKIYPPSGSLEPRDVKGDGTVDILGSIAIELHEETGLDAGAARQGALVAILDQHRISVCQALAFDLSADEIARRFAAHDDPEKELARLVAIRSAAEVAERMPPYAQEMVRRFDWWFDTH
jgi:hypothetical protein